MRIVFALPGLHRVNRGAEVAFESIAREIALTGKHEVAVIGSGAELPDRPYRFQHVPAVPRERFEKWPVMPFLRHEFAYEDLTFSAGLLRTSWDGEADLTVTCSYPYTNWALRFALPGRRRPPHVFVTQNGDWPTHNRRAEYRFFSCDGLVCTNPIYLERNRNAWFSKLIPNGIDPARFSPGAGDRSLLGLPENRPVILMVSALSPSKRVLEGMRAVAEIDDAFFVVAGDGPMRDEVDSLASQVLPGRFLRKTFGQETMPILYRSADVFLHTTIRESFGNVYIEALASGAPVVANDDEVTRWVLGDHAHLVDATSHEALVKTLRTALAAPRGSAQSRSAFAHATYSWKTIAEMYSTFFSEVVSRPHSKNGSGLA
jgi:glycosyltransferase involved in cell wall biosynthesis